jgi:hypothetical protein
VPGELCVLDERPHPAEVAPERRRACDGANVAAIDLLVGRPGLRNPVTIAATTTGVAHR